MFHTHVKKMDVDCEDCWDDVFDACLSCGSTDFFADEREWQRICTSCGCTSAYEYTTFQKPCKPYFYKAENYFANSVIHAAVMKGAPIPADVQDHLKIMFAKSVSLFHRVKHNINRRNYPSYQYTLLRLCGYLGIDVRPFITLPKMKATMDLVVEHWPLIDPVHN